MYKILNELTMKKILNKYLVIALILVTAFSSCKDIFEEDISMDLIVLRSPSDALTTIQVANTFWWDRLDGAREYNIQIVEGSFTSVTTFLLDSTLTNNKFFYTLYPGNFEWRVKGVNNGDETIYSTFSLTIDSANSLISLPITLLSPGVDYITNQDSITLIWDSLYLADNYQVEIYENIFGSILVGLPKLVTEHQYGVKLYEGVFEWGVQGRNANSSTLFSTRKLTIDTTSPSQPTLIYPPKDTATLSNAYHTFTWSSPVDAGTALSDKLYFYTDSTLAPFTTISPLTTNHSDSLGSGTYYWRVQSIDAAGNAGSFTPFWEFTILP